MCLNNMAEILRAADWAFPKRFPHDYFIKQWETQSNANDFLEESTMVLRSWLNKTKHQGAASMQFKHTTVVAEVTWEDAFSPASEVFNKKAA